MMLCIVKHWVLLFFACAITLPLLLVCMAYPELLYVRPSEHGLAKLIIRKRTGTAGWKKLRGTPAAMFVLAMELMTAHTVYLALEAIFDSIIVFINSRGGSWALPGDAVHALRVVVAALFFMPLLKYAVGAPRLSALCVLHAPSLVTLLIAGCESFGIMMAYYLAIRQEAAFSLSMRQIIATPLAEELYFRVAIIHLCVGRLNSFWTVGAVSTGIFVLVHHRLGLIQIVAGWALALRFLRFGANLTEIVLLHSLHNCFIVVTVALHADWVFALVPILVFGTLGFLDTIHLAREDKNHKSGMV